MGNHCVLLSLRSAGPAARQLNCNQMDCPRRSIQTPLGFDPRLAAAGRNDGMNDNQTTRTRRKRDESDSRKREGKRSADLLSTVSH